MVKNLINKDKHLLKQNNKRPTSRCTYYLKRQHKKMLARFRILVPGKHQTILFGTQLLVVAVAIQIKSFQLLRRGQTIFYDVARHQSPGLLGIETQDFILSVFQIFKNGTDYGHREHLRIDGREVFLTGQVNQVAVPAFLDVFVELATELVAPKGIKVFAHAVL